MAFDPVTCGQWVSGKQRDFGRKYERMTICSFKEVQLSSLLRHSVAERLEL